MRIPISPIFLYKRFMNEIFFLLSAFLDLVYKRIITLVLNASKPFKNMFSNEVFCCYIFLSISKKHQVWSATDRKNLSSFWILRNKEQKVRKWNCCTHWESGCSITTLAFLINFTPVHTSDWLILHVFLSKPV